MSSILVYVKVEQRRATMSDQEQRALYRCEQVAVGRSKIAAVRAVAALWPLDESCHRLCWLPLQPSQYCVVPLTRVHELLFHGRRGTALSRQCHVLDAPTAANSLQSNSITIHQYHQ